MRSNSDSQNDSKISEKSASKGSLFDVNKHQPEFWNTATLPLPQISRTQNGILPYYPFTDYINQQILQLKQINQLSLKINHLCWIQSLSFFLLCQELPRLR